MTKHTPTHSGPVWADGHSVRWKDGATRCVAYDTEDAALIVRCVNSFDDLLVVARGAAAFFDGTDAPLGAAAEAAVAQAEATG